MLVVECAPRSGLPLLFDGIIGEVEYESKSDTHDDNHFPREWDVGQAGELMSERWLLVDEIAERLGVNPDTIYRWITRKRMPAHQVGRLWKFNSAGVVEWVRSAKAGGHD